MTERFEVTTGLQRALVDDEAVSGGIAAGTVEKPGVYMESGYRPMLMPITDVAFDELRRTRQSSRVASVRERRRTRRRRSRR
jgi:hypothetical protein